MAKYHINPKTGTVGQCRAKTRCKFSATSEHYEHFEDAIAAAEEQSEFIHRLFSTHDKKPETLPEKEKEDNRVSQLSSLKTPEAKKEARLIQGLQGSTDWTSEASVKSYYVRLEERKKHHETATALTKLQGLWNKARIHNSIFQELKNQ